MRGVFRVCGYVFNDVHAWLRVPRVMVRVMVKARVEVGVKVSLEIRFCVVGGNALSEGRARWCRAFPGAIVAGWETRKSTGSC